LVHATCIGDCRASIKIMGEYAGHVPHMIEVEGFLITRSRTAIRRFVSKAVEVGIDFPTAGKELYGAGA
jgi:hypothetical protein